MMPKLLKQYSELDFDFEGQAKGVAKKGKSMRQGFLIGCLEYLLFLAFSLKLSKTNHVNACHLISVYQSGMGIVFIRPFFECAKHDGIFFASEIVVNDPYYWCI
jgi:hypothetical protein